MLWQVCVYVFGGVHVCVSIHAYVCVSGWGMFMCGGEVFIYLCIYMCVFMWGGLRVCVFMWV